MLWRKNNRLPQPEPSCWLLWTWSLQWKLDLSRQMSALSQSWKQHTEIISACLYMNLSSNYLICQKGTGKKKKEDWTHFLGGILIIIFFLTVFLRLLWAQSMVLSECPVMCCMQMLAAYPLGLHGSLCSRENCACYTRSNWYVRTLEARLKPRVLCPCSWVLHVLLFSRTCSVAVCQPQPVLECCSH